MYPTYNMGQNYPNMYQNFNENQNEIYQDERFIPGGGFIAPLLLGGLAGYAIAGRPNNFQNPYSYPYPYNYYYNNFYYSPYYY